VGTVCLYDTHMGITHPRRSTMDLHHAQLQRRCSTAAAVCIADSSGKGISVTACLHQTPCRTCCRVSLPRSLLQISPRPTAVQFFFLLGTFVFFLSTRDWLVEHPIIFVPPIVLFFYTPFGQSLASGTLFGAGRPTARWSRGGPPPSPSSDGEYLSVTEQDWGGSGPCHPEGARSTWWHGRGETDLQPCAPKGCGTSDGVFGGAAEARPPPLDRSMYTHPTEKHPAYNELHAIAHGEEERLETRRGEGWQSSQPIGWGGQGHTPVVITSASPLDDQTPVACVTTGTAHITAKQRMQPAPSSQGGVPRGASRTDANTRQAPQKTAMPPGAGAASAATMHVQVDEVFAGAERPLTVQQETYDVASAGDDVSAADSKSLRDLGIDSATALQGSTKRVEEVQEGAAGVGAPRERDKGGAAVQPQVERVDATRVEVLSPECYAQLQRRKRFLHSQQRQQAMRMAVRGARGSSGSWGAKPPGLGPLARGRAAVTARRAPAGGQRMAPARPVRPRVTVADVAKDAPPFMFPSGRGAMQALFGWQAQQRMKDTVKASRRPALNALLMVFPFLRTWGGFL
jgi:hypothetical protein